MKGLCSVGFDPEIHSRESFACGHSSLDNYILRNARDDQKEGLARCYVVLEDETRIIGFYTLSMSKILKEDIPPEFLNRKVRYEDIPVILLGRLAVDEKSQHRGIGKFLLVDALKKSVEASDRIGARAVVVDPIDVRAMEFYSKYGFVLLPDSQRMFLPIKGLRNIFAGN